MVLKTLASMLVVHVQASLLPRTQWSHGTLDPCVAFGNASAFNITNLFDWPVQIDGVGADNKAYTFLWSCRGDISCGYMGNATKRQIASAPKASICQVH